MRTSASGSWVWRERDFTTVRVLDRDAGSIFVFDNSHRGTGSEETDVPGTEYARQRYSICTMLRRTFVPGRSVAAAVLTNSGNEQVRVLDIFSVINQ